MQPSLNNTLFCLIIFELYINFMLYIFSILNIIIILDTFRLIHVDILIFTSV